MRVLVTGASGYIGGQTAIQLQDQGHEVYGLDWARLPDHLRSLNLFEGFLQFDIASIESHHWIKMITVCRSGTHNYRSIQKGLIQKGPTQKGPFRRLQNANQNTSKSKVYRFAYRATLYGKFHYRIK